MKVSENLHDPERACVSRNIWNKTTVYLVPQAQRLITPGKTRLSLGLGSMRCWNSIASQVTQALLGSIGQSVSGHQVIEGLSGMQGWGIDKHKQRVPKYQGRVERGATATSNPLCGLNIGVMDEIQA